MNKIKVGDRVIYDDGEIAPVVELRSHKRFSVHTKGYGSCTELLKEDGGDVRRYEGDAAEANKLEQLAENVRRTKALREAAKERAEAATLRQKEAYQKLYDAEDAHRNAQEALIAGVEE